VRRGIPGARHLLVGALLLAVIAVVVVAVVRAGPRHPAAPTSASTPAAGGIALTSPAGAHLDARDRRLLVRVPLANDGSQAVHVLSVTDLPAGFAARLPAGGVPVPAGDRADVELSWAGPDCDGEAPEDLLPELQLQVRPDGDGARQAEVIVATGGTDELLLGARRAACADEPAPTPQAR
jgi:hypothetical protein